jgi:hypothetical protein
LSLWTTVAKVDIMASIDNFKSDFIIKFPPQEICRFIHSPFDIFDL